MKTFIRLTQCLAPKTISDMTQITIHEWSAEQFLNSQNEWNNLLVQSASDPLFMSWEWQSTWWQVFSEPKNMQLQLLAATNDEGKLVGLAPLYLSTGKTKKVITTRQLQFIGNRWRGKATMKTELLDFIAAKPVAEQVIRTFYQHIRNLSNWDELILTDLKKASATYQLLMTEKLLLNCYYRHTEEYGSFFVDTATIDFNSYIKSLGKNTRLRLYNRRKILEKIGDVKFSPQEKGTIKQQFDTLNQLHTQRWGRPVFSNERLLFNETIAQLMDQRGALAFSTLSVAGKTVSIQYNYNLNNHAYNIQAGFAEGFHKKLALGYLHFGYEIERACENGTHYYDFLAGDGKNTPYKERLTKSSLTLVSLQVIRNPFTRNLYRLYDYCRRLRSNPK